MTLTEARQQLKSGIAEGMRCPCCNQFAKVYKRKLTSSMAYALMLMRKWHLAHPDKQWVHVEVFNHTAFRGGDFAKLRYWGLVESKPNEDDPTKKESGMWQLTVTGMQFVSGEVSVPRHVHIYDGRVLGFSTEETTIREALGDKFDYQALMS